MSNQQQIYFLPVTWYFASFFLWEDVGGGVDLVAGGGGIDLVAGGGGLDLVAGGGGCIDLVAGGGIDLVVSGGGVDLVAGCGGGGGGVNLVEGNVVWHITSGMSGAIWCRGNGSCLTVMHKASLYSIDVSVTSSDAGSMSQIEVPAAGCC